ncbi:branched-chain amino acid transport system II carrier protein [Comamonas composti]|uniref:branched-chain amino acid transport system II carrier protein n=1 Tax=Comamonas composti TaxID=408558 RepID=UPI000404E722|nr:branched-chain amino acid transport system II carrier protein [Comamonas composti]
MSSLKTRDIVALGFMTFALFLGAGNIIFPPAVGLSAGENFWSASTGFLLTGVGLPLITVVAMARVGGGIKTITAPIGATAGMALGIVVYLTIGPVFATPRTATVSFEMGVAPFVGNTPGGLFVYSLLYFGLAGVLSLFPGKLVDNLGKLITPPLILALGVLGGAAFLLPAEALSSSLATYQSTGLAFGQGFSQGYQTMDALAALVFGIVIIDAIKSRGIDDGRLHTRYAIIAGVMAAIGLGLLYISLLYLGAHSGAQVQGASSGVQILTAFVQETFGSWGMGLLSVVILLACLTTGVGLITASASFFSRLLPLSYRALVVLLSLFSLVVSNQGLEHLIRVAEPVLVTIYPVAMVLVALSFLSPWMRSASRVFIPTMLTALLCGLIDGMRFLDWNNALTQALSQMPGAAMSLSWLLPVLLVFVLSAALDRLLWAPANAPNAS